MIRKLLSNATRLFTPGVFRGAVADAACAPEPAPVARDEDAPGSYERKAAWRYRVAVRAVESEIARTDRAAAAWLHRHFGEDERDLAYPPPRPGTLRQWVRNMERWGWPTAPRGIRTPELRYASSGRSGTLMRVSLCPHDLTAEAVLGAAASEHRVPHHAARLSALPAE